MKLNHESIFGLKQNTWTQEQIQNFVFRHGTQGLKFIKENEDLGYEELEAYTAIHEYFCLSLKDYFFRRVPYVLSGTEKVKENYITKGWREAT